MKKSYRDAARDLKNLGLVGYDLRKKLSTGQKAQITKIMGKLADSLGSDTARDNFLRHPEKFHVQKVNPKTAGALLDSGYKVLPSMRAIIPLHEYESAKVKGGKVVLQKNGMREEITLVGHRDFFPTLKSLSKKKLARNQMLTVSINGASPFKRARFGSYAELYKYLNDFAPKDPGVSKDELIARMSIVTVEKLRNAPKKAPAKKARRT